MLAVVAALRDLHPRDCQFFSETPFDQLPFPLSWISLNLKLLLRLQKVNTDQTVWPTTKTSLISMS